MSRPPLWVICPFVDLWEEFTQAAAEDVLGQERFAPEEGDRLLLLDNASGEEDAGKADWWVLANSGALIWHHNPALPTLDWSWNCALEAAWAAGCERAWVVNNDVRLDSFTLKILDNAMTKTGALFISAVGVREESWNKERNSGLPLLGLVNLSVRGGPDYSCFLISKEGHQKYPFDPQFTYCGDLDHHRRMMLGGDGGRIFSVNIPYLHFASQTIRKRPELGRLGDVHRTRYREKWGGGPNEETWRVPYNDAVGRYNAILEGPVTTPELQAAVLGGKLQGRGEPVAKPWEVWDPAQTEAVDCVPDPPLRQPQRLPEAEGDGDVDF